MTPVSTIAVVIPLYNKGPHIDRAIQAVLDQTSPPDEIIVVDDLSTDDGVERVLRYNDPRIRVIRRDTPGPGGYAARNAGIEAATSEWIAFLDADDSWMPGAIAEARRLIALSDDGVSCFFTAYARDYGDRLVHAVKNDAVCPGDHRRMDFAQFLDAWLAIGHSPMWTSAVVARRSSAIACGLFPAGKCNRGGDKDTWLRLITVGDVICSPVETATYHRDSVNMVTKITSTNQRPYLCSTLETLIPGAAPALAEKIKTLINWEMYCHARDAWRTQIKVDPGLFKGFRASRAPLTYALLTGMAHAPDWALKASYGLRRLKPTLKLRKVRSA